MGLFVYPCYWSYHQDPTGGFICVSMLLVLSSGFYRFVCLCILQVSLFVYPCYWSYHQYPTGGFICVSMLLVLSSGFYRFVCLCIHVTGPITRTLWVCLCIHVTGPIIRILQVGLYVYPCYWSYQQDPTAGFVNVSMLLVLSSGSYSLICLCSHVTGPIIRVLHLGLFVYPCYWSYHQDPTA